ncbi:DNA gyrase subunit A [Candidatus Woesearchaeota archaeon]|nr:DNA gyrase subunit A [Candidatus Woesearchaeota archaeon]
MPFNEEKEDFGALENASSEIVQDNPKTDQKNKNVVPTIIVDEMKSSFLDYAMSVIVSRALPDVRDGLKPVHRRILFAMNEMAMFHDKPFKKSARIVGEVLGKYHPHGDSAVYDAMVRMAQSFSLRYTLVNGQGNFGSIDGDSAAAMRYTEARLSLAAEAMLEDIKKETVDFIPNFDGSLKEPSVLPGKLPNLLINGSSGIAVGMATNIPPHNLPEVVDGAVHLIDNPDASVQDLMNFVKGPDFPTGGIIQGRQGILHAYSRGRGKVVTRARTEIEEFKGRNRIVVTEIPYMINKSVLIQQIADLIRDKRIQGISDIRDESDREGMRIVIELKSNSNADIVLNQLFKHSRLQTSFGIIMLALVDNTPKVLSLKQVLKYYIKHRQDVVRRRTQFDLTKAEKRLHILEGLIIALNNIDPAIKLIKDSKSVEQAKSSLISSFNLTDMQAQAILDMKLQRLTSLEQDKIKDEHKELLKLVEELKAILGSEQKILDIIKKELIELKDKYGDKRRSDIVDGGDQDIDVEDLIEEEEMVVTVTHSGYIKRVPLSEYKQQKRGGKGVIATSTRDEDFVEHLFTASTHSYILLFTNLGKVYWLKVYNIPLGRRSALGKAVINLLNLDKEEKVTALVPVRNFEPDKFLMMATRKGTVKKTSLEEYSRPRRGGIVAITLEPGDDLIEVIMTSGSDQIILATENGMAVRFSEKDVRSIGRSGKGVRGIALKNNDSVIGMVKADDTQSLLTVTENGYGKRTAVTDYRLISRGGVGVKNIICSERNGKVVAIHSVTDDTEIMLISQEGIVIRIPAKGVSVIGRNTQGLRLMRLNAEDRVVAAAKIISENGDDDADETPDGDSQATQQPEQLEEDNESLDNDV